MDSPYAQWSDKRFLSELSRAKVKLERAGEARFRLPAGSSRARVTTANARWSIAAEAYERLLREWESRKSRLVD